MRNDMRLTYPLWQMAGILIILGFVLLVGYAGTVKTFPQGGFEFEISLSSYSSIFILVMLAAVFLYLILFVFNIAKHNKRMPKHKITMNTFKPQEYLEDDELFQDLTKQATKKVYTYFAWALPIMAAVYMLLPISKTWMIAGILLLAAGQYWIFYWTIKKFMSSVD
ncbi:hypothetical protein DVB69_14775 [Sporosarcina sp. BI001-red]|uniref:hypothetical protein n=1 Tax=Sporosarcina sp. BI001-red TaxID=2282866 RepID=UPI000E22BDF3|nr:hypothetical protein [Sporosarcina sp. BI001-red]REB05534.1 hypothetical protein DVB69_14775 [Sporosarcina sp. BI001-red]